MTREEAKELLPIVQAFAEGKTIQYRVSPSFPRPNNRDISYVKEWFDIDEDKCDGFSCDGTIDYRIKPEPKYRPFKTKEECWNEMPKHQSFGWVKNKATNILYNLLHISKDKVVLGIASGDFVLTLSDLFEYYVFIDGAPFGIKEE